MITIFVHRNGQTEQVDEHRSAPGSTRHRGVVALGRPRRAVDSRSAASSATRSTSIRCRSRTRWRRCSIPKVEAYDGYLYVVLHGIDFHAGEHCFATHDVDFFLGPNYLVTVHDGHVARRSTSCASTCPRNTKMLAEGPVGAVPPHRRRDGRPLPAGGREARGAARRARERGLRDADPALVRRDPRREARRRVAAAGRDRRSATSSAGWRGASSSTSAPRCRSASATSTTTWCGSPTTR